MKFCSVCTQGPDGYLKEADIRITRFSTGPIRGRVARLLAFPADINHEAAGDQLQLLTCEETGAVIGCTDDAVQELRLRERILAGLLRDSLKAGCHVIMLHAASHSARAQAEALIRTTLPPRPGSG